MLLSCRNYFLSQISERVRKAAVNCPLNNSVLLLERRVTCHVSPECCNVENFTAHGTVLVIHVKLPSPMDENSKLLVLLHSFVVIVTFLELLRLVEL